jgi:hypothetical protein
MDNVEKNKYFLLIGFNKIKFSALNQKNEILFNKEILLDSLSLDENFRTLKNFLEKNIIDIEKKLKNYIKDINLIVDYDSFLTIEMSSTHNFKNYIDQSDNISNFLLSIKNNLTKNMADYDLTHMMINKFIVDGKDYYSIPNDDNHKEIFLELRFIFLQNNIVRNFKSIFSKYQILIKNIFCYDYVNNFKNSEKDNIFNLADRLSNGLNKKEILFISKPSKNIGFFEKFFNFFN